MKTFESPLVVEAKYRTRLAVSRQRATFWAMRFQRSGDPGWVISRNTDVCIEGYPRSGNSFAVRVFQYWNPQAQIAHHLHVPMQVRRAVQLKVPTLVLIRQPLDAVASLWVYYGGNIRSSVLLRAYVEFYESVISLADQVAICEFRSVMNDPTVLPRSLNEAYGSKFLVGHWGDDIELDIKRRIADHHNKERDGLMTRLPLPSEEKDEAKSRIKPTIERDHLFDQAHGVYLHLAKL